MAHSTHLVGKCTFQIEVPDLTRAEAIIAIISKLCEQQLPELLDRAFNRSIQPSENVLRLDKLVIDLGELDPDDLEDDLMRRLKIQFTEIFQEAILQQAPVLLPPKERLWDLLAFFLRSGRFPWWAFESGKDHQPEMILSDLLRYHPAETRISLLQMLEEPVVVQRLTQQFSPEALQTVLESLFPADWPHWSAAVAEMITRAAQLYPRSLSESFLWQIVVEHLIPGADRPLQPEAMFRALIHAVAERLSESPQHVLAQIQAASTDHPVLQSVLETISFSGQGAEKAAESADHPVLQNVLETISLSREDAEKAGEVALPGATEALLFFLRQGRLPEESRLSPEDLEQTLLAWLQSDPVHARRALAAINEQVNLGARLTQQFSPEALQTVLESLFPADGPRRWSAAVAEWIGRAAQRYPGALSEVYLWQIVVEYLIPGADRPLQPEAMFQALIHAVAERLSESPQHVLAQIQAASTDHPVLQSVLETISLSREDAEKAAESADHPVLQSVLETISFSGEGAEKAAESADHPVLQNVLETISLSREDAEKAGEVALPGATEALLFFLRQGRLPEESRLSPEDLEQTLLAWLQSDPVHARRVLAAINRQVNLGARLTQQFSPEALQTVLEFLFPADWPRHWSAAVAEMITRAAQLYPGSLSESFLWQIVVEHLIQGADRPLQPEAMFRALLRAGAERLSESPQHVLAQMQAASADHPVLQSALETISFSGEVALPRPTEVLLFFLRQGRLPEGSQLSAAELEQTLLAWLQSDPVHARRVLTEINGQVNLGARLIQQFSPEALQTVLELLFPADWPRWSAAVAALIGRAAQQYPSVLSEVYLWQIVVEHLIPALDRPLQPEAMFRALIRAVAERLSESPQHVLAQIQAASTGHPESDPVHARRALAAINEQVNLGARLTQQFSPEALQTVLESLFPADWPRWSAAVAEMITRAAQLYAGSLSESFLWQIVVEHLIPELGRPLQPEAMFRALIRAVAERLSESPQHVLEQIQAASADHPVLQSVLERISFSGDDAEKTEESADYPVLQSVLETISFSGDDAEKTEGSADHPVLQSVLETIFLSGEDAEKAGEVALPGPAEALLFFLRQGRLPEESRLSPEDLEQTLLAWLQSDPVHARRALTEINGQVNLGARLIGQFSPQVVQMVLKVLLPDQWERLSQLIHDIIQAVDKVVPAVFPEAYFWETSLVLVLKRISPFVNLITLLQDMIRLIDEQSGGLPGRKSVVPQIVRELQSGEYHLFTKMKVQIATGELDVSDQDRLDRTTAQWYDTWKGLSEEETRSYGAIERIQYRLKEGRIAWWDTTSLSIEQLFEQLTLLPAPALQTALKRIFIQDITRWWLQSLPNTTFEKLLGILWKRDAGFVATFRQMNDMVIGIQQVAFDEFLFRESALGMALVSQEMNTRQMLYTLIQSAAKAGRRSATEWAQYLNDEKIIPKDAGNLFFRAFREILEAPVSNQAPDFVMATFDQLMSTGTDQADESPDAILSYSALLESDLAALWQFFHTGTVPARAEISNAIELEQTLFRLLNKHPELAIPFLHKIFVRPAATQRLLQYFNPWLYAAIASRLLAPHFETYTSIRDVFFRQFETENKDVLHRHFYAYLFNVVADNHPYPGDVARFTEGLIQWVSQALGQPEEQIWTHLRWMLEKPDNPMGILGKILPALLEQRQKMQKRIRLEETPPSRILSESETKEEIIVVQNAGLILVAPFLPRLFGSLNLLENQVFTSVEAAVKSVHLLQYLATGLTETREQFLVFNKVLCGLPLETPIPLRVELSEDEKERCMSLLKAVLSNWEIMKNSSIVNLRGAFLLREGTLREQPDRWLLHVEKKTYDIVLDYIPWTISMVKLPWMEKRIEIEWKKKS